MQTRVETLPKAPSDPRRRTTGSVTFAARIPQCRKRTRLRRTLENKGPVRLVTVSRYISPSRFASILVVPRLTFTIPRSRPLGYRAKPDSASGIKGRGESDAVHTSTAIANFVCQLFLPPRPCFSPEVLSRLAARTSFVRGLALFVGSAVSGAVTGDRRGSADSCHRRLWRSFLWEVMGACMHPGLSWCYFSWLFNWIGLDRREIVGAGRRYSVERGRLECFGLAFQLYYPHGELRFRGSEVPGSQV